jgi:hypothetical protein
MEPPSLWSAANGSNIRADRGEPTWPDAEFHVSLTLATHDKALTFQRGLSTSWLVTFDMRQIETDDDNWSGVDLPIGPAVVVNRLAA